MYTFKEITEIIRLYRISKNINSIKHDECMVERFFDIINRSNNYGSKRARNLATNIVKQLRKLYPYKPTDYSKAKKLYYDYFKIDNHIPSFEHIRDQTETEDVYVVNFRSDAPCKGDKFNDYYINFYSSIGQTVYKLTTMSESRKYINIEDPTGRTYVHSIEKDFYTNFRYANKKEIASFKSIQKKIKKVQGYIDTKQKEMYVLHSELNKIITK